jgi:hypothetical protein
VRPSQLVVPDERKREVKEERMVNPAEVGRDYRAASEKRQHPAHIRMLTSIYDRGEGGATCCPEISAW